MNRLGKTNLIVSKIGFGGIVAMNAEPGALAKVVADTVEFGINYFDVAPSYGDAEIKLGSALKPFRKDVHLACKTELRDAAGAKSSLRQSLKNLQTDYFDLYQLHGLTDIEKDVRAVFAKGGAMEVVIEAKKNGIVRNVGFSAHCPQAALEAMKEYDFDTVMFPVNFCLHFRKNFEVPVLCEAKKRQMGIIALKAIAKQKWLPENKQKRREHPKSWYEPIDDPSLARAALSWTLNQGVNVALSPGDESLLRLCMKVLPECKKPDSVELEKLAAIAKNCLPIF